MTELIQKWITNCIGLVMNMDPQIFTADVMDGTILARILHSYHIISQDQFISIVPTDNPSVAYKNLKRIGLWLNANGIKCIEEDLLDISLGKSSSAIKLFYQLYLALHDKDKLHFTAKRRGKERLHPNDTRFEVIPVEETTTDSSNVSDHPLSEQLVLRRDIIQWNQNRYQTLLEDYEVMREKYAKYIHDKYSITYRDKFAKIKSESPTSKEEDEMNKKFPEIKEYSYEELIEQQKNAKQMKTFVENPKMAKKIVNTLKQKHRREVKENEIKLYQQRVLLMEMWEKLLNDQEKEFEETISKKMLKQSEFEKQMATKMFEVRQQKQNMLENRRFIDDETAKKREAEFLENVFLREKSVGDQKYNYYFERDRTLELHRRIYAEKNRLKSERYDNMCRDVVKDLVNVAIRHSEFKEKFNEEVPKRFQKEWINLVIKQQPVFDLLDEIEDIVQDNKNLPQELEEIHRIEINRQNELDQRDFENYLYFEWPWRLEELLINYEEILLSIELGLNVLGHAAHQMLLAKYPKPKPPPKPDIPRFDIAVCINSLPDTTILPVLQKLLIQEGVKVIEMQDAINFCLNVFNDEIKTEFIDKFLVGESEAALEELKGKSGKGKSPKDTKELSKKGAKTKTKASKGTENARDESLTNSPHFADKQCQTPRIYPCEEIVLSPTGELGKMAYDILNIGEQLTDNLVVAMFIEYLKSLKDIEGWVLINYPTTLGQAAILEEALTGIKIPGISDEVILYSSISIGDVADLLYRESQWEQEEENAILRNSRILPNPDSPCEESEYETYLTAYIHAQPKIEEENRKSNSDERNETRNRDSLESKSDRSSEEVDEIESLETFYRDQGCNYAFYYKNFDFATIKHLAKLIIGDYSIPPKTSLELFGDTVLFVEANLGEGYISPRKESKGGKVEKPKKPEKGNQKIDADVKGRQDEPLVEIIAGGKADKQTQIPELSPKSEELFRESLPGPRAGENLWQYSDLSLPDHFQVALGTFWENIEDVYVCDFKELFFIKRIILNAIIPYLTHVRQHMEIFIARPDNKQNYLYQFQTIYNEIDADLRDDVELKAEIHCRIAEFREKLWEICDTRMKESEEERRRIINEGWITAQACELINNYITAMQLEIDRACDTLQFLTDYYTGLITKMPSEEPPLQKTTLNRIEINKNTSTVSFSENIKGIISAILITVDSESTETPLHHTMLQIAETAISAITRWKPTALSAVTKMETFFKPATGKKEKTAQASSKKGKDEKKLPKFVEPEPSVKEAGPRLIEEWNCAVDGESLRAKLRIDILVKRGALDLNDMLNHSKKIFYNLYGDIRDRYNTEIRSVDIACEVLAAAVEAEMPLQPELVLDGDKFYVDPNVLLFPQALPAPEPSLKEKDNPGVFTIQQLEVLRNILIDLAPNASIPERTFVYLLQDLIVQNAEDGKEPMVPPLWKRLQPNLVSQLSIEIFGDIEFIDWREFIIYNLCIEFPSEHDLIIVREQFREYDPDLTETIKDYQFYTIRLWFEELFEKEDPQEIIRITLIKEQLFKLYRINEDTINYTALLLAFCKDVDPIKGFAKALTLALGKYVCWDTVIGNAFIENLREQRFIDEKMELERKKAREEALTCAESVVNTVVDKTVHLCDSVVIEDYQSSEQLIDDATATSQEQRDSAVDIEFASFDGKVLKELYSSEMKTSDSVIKSQEMFLMEEEFSNTEIGFQPAYNPPKVYFMPFEVLLTVLTASLPWHARAQTINDESFRGKLEAIYSSVKNPEFENNVFTHQILNDVFFKELLWNNFKFVIKNPVKIVERLIRENCGVCCSSI